MARHVHPPISGHGPTQPDSATHPDVAFLYRRDRRFPAGSIVPDLTHLAPGDVLLFHSGGQITNPVTFYQRMCGHPMDAAGYTHAALFLRDDRIVHATPELSLIGTTGVRVIPLFDCWANQSLTVLRAHRLSWTQLLEIALSGSAMHGLRYGYQGIRFAIRHLLRLRPNTTQSDIDDLIREQHAGQPTEALPTTSSCARLVISAFDRVDPGHLRGRRRSPIPLPADLAALASLHDIRMPYVQL